MWILLALLLQTNPHTSPQDLERGERLYRFNCARCHGLAGEGGRGPNLADGDFYHGDTDEALFGNVRDGIAGTEMPSSFLTPASVWQMVAFVRSLNQASVADTISGDPGRGRALFRGEGGCLQCHRVDHEGGFAGPNLSTIASRRSSAYLRASLLDPDEDVGQKFWTVRVAEKRSGATTTGFLRNEDRHTILLLDLDGALRAFGKEELSSIEVDRRSTMQSFEGLFEASEVEDLVAYLATLRKASAE